MVKPICKMNSKKDTLEKMGKKIKCEDGRVHRENRKKEIFTYNGN